MLWRLTGRGHVCEDLVVRAAAGDVLAIPIGVEGERGGPSGYVGAVGPGRARVHIAAVVQVGSVTGRVGRGGRHRHPPQPCTHGGEWYKWPGVSNEIN